LALATTYNGNATPPTAAGTYTVVATVNNPNFNGSTNGTLTVRPAALTITASDRSKTYGQAVAFTGTEFTPSTLPNSETVGSVTLTSSGAVATAPVTDSPYSIVPSAATGGTFNPADYAISYQNGALRVDLAALAVTADNKVRVHGATNPVFTGTVIGVQNSDNITADYACTATPASAAGLYEIVPTLLDPSGKLGNYSVTTNNGVLTVVSGPAIVNPTLAGSNFSLSVPTAAGLNYALEYKESLEDLHWAVAQTQSGTGSTITLTDGMATNTARFYRVRVE
jgi:PKD repeat protein